jgi:hypothetical protein
MDKSAAVVEDSFNCCYSVRLSLDMSLDSSTAYCILTIQYVYFSASAAFFIALCTSMSSHIFIELCS